MKTAIPESGPFPLNLKTVGERYVITTYQGNHWVTTFDPQAARLSLAAPEMLQALEELTAEREADPATTHNNETFGYQLARDAIAKATQIEE